MIIYKQKGTFAKILRFVAFFRNIIINTYFYLCTLYFILKTDFCQQKTAIM